MIANTGRRSSVTPQLTEFVDVPEVVLELDVRFNTCIHLPIPEVIRDYKFPRINLDVAVIFSASLERNQIGRILKSYISSYFKIIACNVKFKMHLLTNFYYLNNLPKHFLSISEGHVVILFLSINEGHAVILFSI